MPAGKKGAYSISVEVYQNAVALLFSNIMLDGTFHTMCQSSASKMDINWATLATTCRLGYSIF